MHKTHFRMPWLTLYNVWTWQGRERWQCSILQCCLIEVWQAGNSDNAQFYSAALLKYGRQGALTMLNFTVLPYLSMAGRELWQCSILQCCLTEVWQAGSSDNAQFYSAALLKYGRAGSSDNAQFYSAALLKYGRQGALTMLNLTVLPYWIMAGRELWQCSILQCCLTEVWQAGISDNAQFYSAALLKYGRAGSADNAQFYSAALLKYGRAGSADNAQFYKAALLKYGRQGTLTMLNFTVLPYWSMAGQGALTMLNFTVLPYWSMAGRELWQCSILQCCLTEVWQGRELWQCSILQCCLTEVWQAGNSDNTQFYSAALLKYGRQGTLTILILLCCLTEV